MIHQYKSKGQNIVIDVNSGAIHSVSDTAYDIISEVNGLYEKGQLFSPDRSAGEGRAMAVPVVKALCLHVAHACNLACRYCFADEGTYRGHASLMSARIGRAAIDFLVAGSGRRVNLEVDFFGGEPLLNWDVIKEVVAYGRSLEAARGKKFRFTLTTNGLLLDEGMFDFINSEMSNIILSIDGRREVHDGMRPRPDGSGSYDSIIGIYKELVESRRHRDYFLRGTFTRRNLDFTEDVRHLAEQGFGRISLEPAIGVKGDFAIGADDIPAICDEYDRLADYLIARCDEGRPIEFFHFMMDLDGGPCLNKRLAGCGAGSEYLAVTPEGDLYPCHQFVGRRDFLVGSLTDGVTCAAIGDSFRAATVDTKAHCRECFARYFCSGGCAAGAEAASGNILGCDEIACALMRKRIECAIMLKTYKGRPC